MVLVLRYLHYLRQKTQKQISDKIQQISDIFHHIALFSDIFQQKFSAIFQQKISDTFQQGISD